MRCFYIFSDFSGTIEGKPFHNSSFKRNFFDSHYFKKETWNSRELLLLRDIKNSKKPFRISFLVSLGDRQKFISNMKNNTQAVKLYYNTKLPRPSPRTTAALKDSNLCSLHRNLVLKMVFFSFKLVGFLKAWSKGPAFVSPNLKLFQIY